MSNGVSVDGVPADALSAGQGAAAGAVTQQTADLRRRMDKQPQPEICRVVQRRTSGRSSADAVCPPGSTSPGAAKRQYSKPWLVSNAPRRRHTLPEEAACAAVKAVAPSVSRSVSGKPNGTTSPRLHGTRSVSPPERRRGEAAAAPGSCNGRHPPQRLASPRVSPGGQGSKGRGKGPVSKTPREQGKGVPPASRGGGKGSSAGTGTNCGKEALQLDVSDSDGCLPSTSALTQHGEPTSPLSTQRLLSPESLEDGSRRRQEIASCDLAVRSSVHLAAVARRFTPVSPAMAEAMPLTLVQTAGYTCGGSSSSSAKPSREERFHLCSAGASGVSAVASRPTRMSSPATLAATTAQSTAAPIATVPVVAASRAPLPVPAAPVAPVAPVLPVPVAEAPAGSGSAVPVPTSPPSALSPLAPSCSEVTDDPDGVRNSDNCSCSREDDVTQVDITTPPTKRSSSVGTLTWCHPLETPREAAIRRKREAADREIERMTEATISHVAVQPIRGRPGSRRGLGCRQCTCHPSKENAQEPVTPDQDLADAVADQETPAQAARRRKQEAADRDAERLRGVQAEPVFQKPCPPPVLGDSIAAEALLTWTTRDDVHETPREAALRRKNEAAERDLARLKETLEDVGVAKPFSPKAQLPEVIEGFYQAMLPPKNGNTILTPTDKLNGETPREAARRRRCEAADRELARVKEEHAEAAGTARQIAIQLRDSHARSFLTPFATAAEDRVAGVDVCRENNDILADVDTMLPAHSVLTPCQDSELVLQNFEASAQGRGPYAPPLK